MLWHRGGYARRKIDVLQRESARGYGIRRGGIGELAQIMEGCGRKIGPFDCCTAIAGDCLDVMAEMPKGLVPLVIADPPYGSGGRDGSVHLENPTIALNRMSSDSYIWFVRQYAKQLFRITTADAHCYIFSDWRKFTHVRTAFEVSGWECRQLIVWDKGVGMGEYWRSSHEFILWLSKQYPRKLTHGGCFNVLRYKGVYGKAKDHPAQKPKELVRFLVEASTKIEDLVIDPFFGSGTTLVEAKSLGRHFFGCDINPDYVAMTEKRLSTVQLAMEL